MEYYSYWNSNYFFFIEFINQCAILSIDFQERQRLLQNKNRLLNYVLVHYAPTLLSSPDCCISKQCGEPSPQCAIYYYSIYCYNRTMKILLLIFALIIEIITLIIWATFSTNLYFFFFVVEFPEGGLHDGIVLLIWFISTFIYLITNLSLIISIIATINLLRKKSLSLLEKISLFIAAAPIILFLTMLVIAYSL